MADTGLTNGYPTQEEHKAEELIVGKETRLLEYGFPFDLRTGLTELYVPNTSVELSFEWSKKITHRVAVGLPLENYRFSSALTVTEQVAHQASIGFSVALEAGVNFGVVAKVTIAASIGYAITISSSRGRTEGWLHTVPVAPGIQIEIWTRAVKVSATSPDLNQLSFTKRQEIILESARVALRKQGKSEEEANAFSHMSLSSWLAVYQGGYFPPGPGNKVVLREEYTLPGLESYTVSYPIPPVSTAE